MNFLVKEVLYLLDYEDNIKETLFISTDKRTPGYAYEINIKDYNTGYSDLSFRMPCDITNEDGEIIKNPKLELLVPLSKVRYNRTVRYMGKEPISVPEPDGSTKIYPEEDGNRLLENYTMDYIIQPLDKSRQGIGISLTYTAIDFPRFNLSKKKVGLTFNENTITTQELSLYKNVPLSVPGSIQYIPWMYNDTINYGTVEHVQSYINLSSITAVTGTYCLVNDTKVLYQKQADGTWKAIDRNSMMTWSPNAQAQTYPIDEDSIKKLVNETKFSYGMLATIYYWPVTESGRFQGVWYEEGGFITLSLYNTYEGSDWEGSDYLESITHEWGHLDPIQHYLSPNNACNYLRYIVKDTNWKVAGDFAHFIKNTSEQKWFDKDDKPATGEEKDYYITYEDLGEDKYEIQIYQMLDGRWVNQTGTTLEQIVNTDIEDEDFGMMYDIDIEQVDVSRSAEASLGQIEKTDARYALSVSNANCYNAITSEAKLFDLYPVFDCLNRRVSLKLNVGKDYGLSYRYKSNLKNSSVKVDGEKVITKLYVNGGTDAQGEQNITIGEANRIISGEAANLETAANEPGYLKSSLITDMITLETNIYEHINGKALATTVNMSNQKFKLTFPDNLFDTEKNNTAQTTKKIVGFSSGKSINKIYNPTGNDYCYYIYIRHNADDDYKNEKNQLYKFDGANITLRRNLKEYFLQDIGTVNFIASGETNITNNIKYCPALDARVKQDGNMYIGTVINKETNDGKYILTIEDTNESFVLVGPDRVYNVPAGETATYNYGVGNYYYIEDTNTYRYCANQYSDTGSSISKINNISVNGYVFVEMGGPNKELIININGVDTNVYDKDGDELLLKDWFVNDFCLRVIFDGTTLRADEQFNPNADEYLVCRSPYGTSYIYNFKYLYDNGWMTEEAILDIYAKNKELNDLNLDFYNRYTKDLVNIQAAYNDAVNNYDIYSSKADAQLEALMSQYWVNPNKASDGQFSAFPGKPADVSDSNFDTEKNKYYMDITYEEPQGDGTTKDIKVKTVYFDIFGSTSCVDNYPNATDNRTAADNPYTEGQYHVVAKALGWNNYYRNKLTINSEIGGYTEAQDPSKTADSYNKFVQQMKEYYYRAMKADEQMVEAQEALEALMERYKEWEEEVAEIEKYLQKNYGEYIIEGSYSNTEQPYANLLIDDGLEASEKYATPDITYTVGVVDSSGLIEYRAPHKLICNDLIKRLHNIGQIAPHVGDYVAIQDEPMGMYGVPGLITQISRRIDDPYQNTITIDTSYTDADELVGNIITATNTVLNNKDIYGRAAIINNKGELSSTTVTNALSTGTDSINIISTSGKVAVDDNGLTCINPHNKNEVMRYNGTGILGSNNGGATWRELLTQDGINANYINAGTINAGKVSITDGGHDVTVMNADGLVVKTNPNSPYVLGTLNENGVTKAFENITVFVGRAADGEGIGYFNGYINATKGGNIAGWTIKPTALHTSNNSLYLGTTGITAAIGGTNRSDLVFKAGDSFGVSSGGTLYANGAQIKGDIYANSLTLSSTVDIPEGNIDSLGNYFKKDREFTVGTISDGQNTIGFQVSNTGLLTANNAIIYGTIYAKAGEFAGELKAATGSFSGAITASSLTLTGTATVDAAKVSGTLSAARISGSNISGGTITGSHIHLNGGSVKLCTGGRVEFTNGTGFFSMGPTSSCSDAVAVTHPYVSGLNVATQGSNTVGISFRTGQHISNAGEEGAHININSNNQLQVKSFGNMNLEGNNIAIQSVATGSSSYIRLATGELRLGSSTNYQTGLTKRVENVDIAYGSPVHMTFVHGILVSVDPA